jgi:GTP-binding protein
LLNELTNAKSRVANYPFTTLEPNLGVYYELILADIPGLIEGASAGRGLGVKFLQHIERTKTLFHLISAESENPLADYAIIRKELGDYNEKLALKSEYIFLTKSDMVSVGDLEVKISALKKIGKAVIPVSIHDEDSLNKVKEILNDIKRDGFKTPFAAST